MPAFLTKAFQYGASAEVGTVPMVLILGAARGLPLVALATLGYDATMGVALRGDSPIRTSAPSSCRTRRCRPS
jgi:ABC-type nitrate/sulfonate/bicarbonate transport system substrate-binding protein